MAKILWGMMIVNGRGKLGGHVLTKARSGATVRTRVTPRNPQTAVQGLVRAIFASLSSAWRGLTEEQRLAWNNAVELYQKTNVFGDNYLPSGKNLFVGLNTNLLNISAAQINVPVAPVEIPPYIADEVNINLPEGLNAGTVDLNIITDEPGAGTMIVYEATAPQSAGRFNFSGSYRRIGQALGNAPAGAESLYNLYIAKFSVPPAGQKISFRLSVVSTVTGQKSPSSSVDGIVVQP